ncbi:MAG: NAD(P)/FAD-dependent oxidoreductase [Pseudomonadota bacterium]
MPNSAATPAESASLSAADSAVVQWLAALEAALLAEDVERAVDLFEPDGYWRDLVAFTWNIKTMEGRGEIAQMLGATLASCRPTAWRLTSVAHTDGEDFSAWIAFETVAVHGAGRVTLRNGRARVLFTAATDLTGFEEPSGPTRPQGLAHKAQRERETWTDRRQAQIARLGREDQPHTLIIGGGQGGLALAARLKQHGVPALIVERNARPGDSWRNRYRSLVLHDPVWYDHMPYLPFPPNWPVFTPKDKMGDWLEAYAKVFELDIWCDTVCEKAVWDPHAKRWAVTVIREGEAITLAPRELVFATGAYGPPREINWPGRERFAGQVIHSAAYRDGAGWRGKRCVVVGSASSAHDVAVDLWEAGAEVTMLQRSPTIVVRSETLMEMGFSTYSEAAVAAGLTVEKADMLAASTPFKPFIEGQKPLWREIAQRDADFYAALGAAGFAYDFGEDGTGQMARALRTASNFYIDVGGSELIARKEIGLEPGAQVDSLTETGLRLTDGRAIAADLIVACIGYQSMNESVATIVSREAADLVGPCWGLGSGVRGDPGPWQGELRNMWKPTAHDGLWFHGGNLALSRFYSKYLALQLKARLEGLDTPVYGRPAPGQPASDPPGRA